VALALLRLYVVTLYAYSGLQKLNASFVHEIAPTLVDPVLHRIGITPPPAGAEAWVPIAVPMVPVAGSPAVPLLVPRARWVGVVLAVLMHAFLLLAIGPLGSTTNQAVWPWDAFMIAAIPLLFWDVRGSWLAPVEGRPLALAISALIVVYPAGFAA